MAGRKRTSGPTRPSTVRGAPATDASSLKKATKMALAGAPSGGMHETSSGLDRRLRLNRGNGLGRERRRLDGAVRRQLPDRAPQRPGRSTPAPSTASTCRSRTRRTTSPSSSTRSTTSSPRASTRSSSTRSTPRRPRRCRTRPPRAGMPLVFVNREPINVDTLPDNQAFVASDERESGTLETKEVCRLFKEAGKTEASVYVIMGAALEPGGAAAHPGHPRRDRLRRVRRDAQHHRQADLELGRATRRRT